MLIDSIKKRILECHERLNAAGKLIPRQKLDRYYAAFQSRFGPDQLSKLDGEALLNTIHLHGNHDSLVYWLEFKNDDEFRTPDFGSIAGGSALKFGIFQRKDTGSWATFGDETRKPKEITVEEAIRFARKHRDQLIRGAELLEHLPANGTDEDYRALQANLDKVAPDVSDLAWGHKYFSLIFPDKLDDFHSPGWQRYHLLKLLQEPPEGDGRYLCAGRYVAACNEFKLQMVNFDYILNELNGPKHAYWRIGTSDSTTPRNRWNLMRDGNFVAVGWPALGDLSTLEATKDGNERLWQLLEKQYPAVPQLIGRCRKQISNFVNSMTKGDLVLAADGATVLGIGEVTGGYTYDPESDFPHRRPVDWLSFEEWKMPDPEGVRTTLYAVKKHRNILQTERNIQGKIPPKPIVGPDKPVLLTHLSGIPGHIQSVLERKNQVILYGPPGTGKTYWAEKTACELASISAFGKTFENLNAEERKAIAGTGDGLVRVCCFHPAYGYEDFIEGYRPETNNGQMSFALRPGIFKRLCADASKSPNQRFYVIIDEINRGDIPRIFGELLTVLEKDKRGKAILLPMTGEAFDVPPNVFLIGTMNTADRSISLLDAALRRRFGFIELMPDSTILKDHVVSGIPLGPWFEALNRRICEHVGRDARNLQIGHSYLLQGGSPLKDIATLRRVVRDDIIPLLQEYCYEDFSALQNILGSGLLNVEKQRINHELFGDGQEAELILALLQQCPDIVTTTDAESAESESEDVNDESDTDEVET